MNLIDTCVLLLGNPRIETHRTPSLISIHCATASAGVIHVTQRELTILGGHDGKLIWKTHTTVLLP